MRGGDEEIAAVASNHGERGDTLAGREAGDAIAESVNVADDVIAGSEGKGLLNGIEAVPHEYVGIDNAGGDDFDTDLTWAGGWQIVFDPLENFRPTATGDNDAGVFRGGHKPTVAQGKRIRQLETLWVAAREGENSSEWVCRVFSERKKTGTLNTEVTERRTQRAQRKTEERKAEEKSGREIPPLRPAKGAGLRSG